MRGCVRRPGRDGRLRAAILGPHAPRWRGPELDPGRACLQDAGPPADAHKKGERERILQALSASNWNRVKAAELIGMPRRTFYRRLKDYGIQ